MVELERQLMNDINQLNFKMIIVCVFFPFLLRHIPSTLLLR